MALKKINIPKRTLRVNPIKRKQNSVDIGYGLADQAVKKWNTEPNPPKVYINGNRIHHGFAGFTSTAVGIIGLFVSALSDDKKTRNAIANVSGLLIGAGVRLMEDDVEDVNDWFNFEKNNSTYPPQFQTAYVQPLQFHPTTVLPIGRSTEFI